MAHDDKYPESSARRRFVKGVVGSATLVGVGTASAGMVDSMTQRSGAGGGQTEFYGVENTAGPAPRAMPQIPVRIDDEGYIQGLYPEIQEEQIQGRTVQVPREQVGPVEYKVDWFQYCGVQGYEGIQPSYEGDDYFRYASGSGYDWQGEDVQTGQRVHVDDFADYEDWGNGIGRSGLGKPAMATWRSEDTEETIPVQIIRSPRIEQLVGSLPGEAGEWLSASTERGFIAIMDKCTHFCCVPKFKATQQSAQFGTDPSGDDGIYCPCHQSVYDPFSIVKRSFVAFPRPEDD